MNHMDISSPQFTFTPLKLELLHEISARTGKTASEVLDYLLHQSRPSDTPAQRSALDAFEQAGVIGCVDGFRRPYEQSKAHGRFRRGCLTPACWSTRGHLMPTVK